MSQEQKEAIIIEYNKMREEMDSKELLNSVLELPPFISFYIVKLKKATFESDLDKVKDYIIWKKYYAELPTAKEIYDLKQEFYDMLYVKYDNSGKDRIIGSEKLEKIVIKTEAKLLQKKRVS